MNREILFRGKRVDNGEWLYGYYVYNSFSGRHFIMDTPTGMSLINSDEVHPATVGQFMGLLDKDGKKIFEGDRVKVHYFRMALGENLGAYETEEELFGVIRFDGLSLIVDEIESDKWSEYTGYSKGEGATKYVYLHDVYDGSESAEMGIEVIGNIHETTQSNEQS